MFTSPLRELRIKVREWVLTHSLVWRDAKLHIKVPAKFITDHASIPDVLFLRPALEEPTDDNRPFVLHDWLYCSSRNFGAIALTRRQADNLLRVAMLATGHGQVKALTYYMAVRIGGWRYWNKKAAQGLTTEDFLS